MGALDPRTALAAVKLAHAAVWAVFAGCILWIPVAARFTDQRAANFDIYLPEWLARNNQRLFGALFVLGLAILAWSWLGGGLPPLTPSGPL
jgi:hypothetical protein